MATTTPTGVRGGHAKHGGSPDPSSGAPMTHRQIMEALAGLMLGMFVAILSSTVVSNALPEIISDLGGGQSAYTWVVTASLLAMTATTPLWGKLSDLFSKKLLVQIALVIYVAGSVVAGMSTSSGMLIACRVVQGIGVGGLSALAQIVMAAMIAPRERGRYSGYIGAVFAVATVGGPLLGGVITDTSWMGWRWCFYVGVPFAVIALIVLQKTLKLPVVKRQVKVDWWGAFFISAAVSLLLLWVTFAGDKYDWLSWQTAAMLIGSVALAGLFVVVESKASEPIIPLRLFRNRTITLASLASLFVGVAMFAGTVFFSQYFQLARGKSPTMSGVMTIPMIAGLFISSTVSGQVITKTGRWKAWLVSGGFLVTAGLGLLGTIRYDTEYWHIAVFMAVMGLGIGMMMQNLVLATQNQVAPSDLGSASSVVTFFRSLGGAIGVSALGAVMANRVTHYVKDGLAELGPKGAAMGHGGTGGGGIPDLDKLPAPFRTVVESAYGHGVGDVFLYAAPAALVAFLITIFIKEVALKTNASSEAPATAETPVVAAVEAAAATAEPVSEAAAGITAVDTLEAPVATLQGTAVHGVVRGAEGAPVARAAVTLISLAGRQLGRSVAQDDGGYGLDAPGSGSYVLIASADGYQPQASTVVVGDEPLAYDILLSGTSGLAGVVRAAESTAPVEGAMVIVTDVRGEVLATGKSGETGEFAFGELVPGSVTVAVNAAGFRPLALPVEIGGQGVTRVEAALQAGALVQGVVRAGTARRPMPDARVTLVDAAGNVIATSTTGEDGAYAFTDLDAGEYSVIATGYPPVASALTVAGRGADGHDIELAHPGADSSSHGARRENRMGLRAQVRTRDGWAVQHAVVTVTDMTGTQVLRATADEDGAVRTGSPLEAGAYTVIVTAVGYAPAASTALVTASGRVEAGTVVLARQGGVELPPPGAWSLDPAHSSVAAVAQHLGISSVHGRFTEFSGRIEIAEDVQRSRVDAVISAASIDTGNSMRDKHLRSPDFLDSERFPEITYRSNGLTPAGPDRWLVHGELSLHGVVRPVDLNLSYLGTGPDPWGGVRAAFNATAELRREDFAMNYNQVVQAGISAIGTTLRVELDVQAVQGESLPS